jgi:hypothetical protein
MHSSQSAAPSLLARVDERALRRVLARGMSVQMSANIVRMPRRGAPAVAAG